MSPITVYSKPACVQCTATYKALDNKGILYNVVDITEDDTARERLMAQGFSSAPIVETPNATWSGFRHDLIAQL